MTVGDDKRDGDLLRRQSRTSAASLHANTHEQTRLVCTIVHTQTHTHDAHRGDREEKGRAATDGKHGSGEIARANGLRVTTNTSTKKNAAADKKSECACAVQPLRFAFAHRRCAGVRVRG